MFRRLVHSSCFPPHHLFHSSIFPSLDLRTPGVPSSSPEPTSPGPTTPPPETSDSDFRLSEIPEAGVTVRFNGIRNHPEDYPELVHLGQRSTTGSWNSITLEFIQEFLHLTMYALELYEDVFRDFQFTPTDVPEPGSLRMTFRIRKPEHDPRTPQTLAEELRQQMTDPRSRWRRVSDNTLIHVFLDREYFEFSLFGFTIAFLTSLELWEMLALLGGVLLAGLLLFLWMKQKWPDANNVIGIFILASLLDLFTDVVFVMSLSRISEFETEFRLALLFVLLPVLANSGLTLWILNTEYAISKVIFSPLSLLLPTSSDSSDHLGPKCFVRSCVSFFFCVRSGRHWIRLQGFRMWSIRHSVAMAFAGIFGMLSSGNARLICSGIFGLQSLSAPMTRYTQERLKFWSIASVLLEDVPQLVLQAMVIEREGSFENTAALAMLMTVLTITFSITLRMSQRFLARRRDRGREIKLGELPLETEEDGAEAFPPDSSLEPAPSVSGQGEEVVPSLALVPLPLPAAVPADGEDGLEIQPLQEETWDGDGVPAALPDTSIPSVVAP